jgi:NADH:ubiquinone oxidoreductase subunit
MQLPTNWQGVTLDQWIEFTLCDLQEFETSFDYHIERLSILADSESDDEYWQELSVPELNGIITAHKWINTAPTSKRKGVIYGKFLKPFESLSLGEFIDLDYFYTHDQIGCLKYICGILYRKTKEDEWGNIIFEPYKYNVEERSKEYLNVNITEVYSLLPEWVKYREYITSSYPIFEPQVELNEDELTPEELQEEKEAAKFAQFAWESAILDLTHNDITKVEAVLNLPLIFVLNQMTLLKAFK